MIYDYRENHKVSYSDTDNKLNLSITAGMNLAQDMMTDYFQVIKCGNDINKTKHNAVWVLTKSRIHFIKHPKLFDELNCICNTTLSKLARIGLESVFTNMDSEQMFIVSQECCAIDFTTRKIRKINTISYPEDIEPVEPANQDPYFKIDTVFEEKDFADKLIVKSCDIDFNNHANNVSYARFIINTLDTNFLNNVFIRDFELHYINECLEKDILKIYKVQKDENIIDFLIKTEQKDIAKARIVYEKI